MSDPGTTVEYRRHTYHALYCDSCHAVVAWTTDPEGGDYYIWCAACFEARTTS